MTCVLTVRNLKGSHNADIKVFTALRALVTMESVKKKTYMVLIRTCNLTLRLTLLVLIVSKINFLLTINHTL